MDFDQGGLYSQYRDEGCFVKYMADAIQSAQLHLKNEQWNINADFEEFLNQALVRAEESSKKHTSCIKNGNKK